MKCPHCTVEAHIGFTEFQVGNDKEGQYRVFSGMCPSCQRVILKLKRLHFRNPDGTGGMVWDENEMIFRPKVANRNPIPEEVPADFANDYREACLVLADSPKSSAALSRRCLQHILREVAKVKKGDLYNEIQEVIDSGKLPSQLSDDIDYIRHVGNIAAHTTKSKSTGEIVDVESGEAEWTLDVLESLFDFYFVLPAKARQKREALNKKLVDAGKKPMTEKETPAV